MRGLRDVNESHRWAVLVVMMGLAACDDGKGPAPPATKAPAVYQSTPADQAATVRRQVVSWLECEECDEGELDVIKKIGPSVVPVLAATLRSGPSAATRETLRLQLVESHREMSEYAKNHPGFKLNSTESEYVGRYLAKQDLRYRMRALRALESIGGDEARNALRGVIEDQAAGAAITMRPEVYQAILEALRRLEVSAIAP